MAIGRTRTAESRLEERLRCYRLIRGKLRVQIGPGVLELLAAQGQHVRHGSYVDRLILIA